MKNKVDYRQLFTLGIVFLGLGSAYLAIEKMRFLGPVFMCAGGVLMLISGKHKDEWKDDDKK
ncbi:hypothetical protein GF382_00145 [Candidatus Falkowbacteria bacterium]|nr:hypothetical protein [Candidatus Falkowbacteria bacterium]